MKLSGNAIIAKTLAVYGDSLTDKDYDALLRKNSVKSAVAYLKGTKRYGRVFAGLDDAFMHRGRIELLLRGDVFDIYARLCDFIPVEKGGFRDFALKRAETESILVALTFASIGAYDQIAVYLPEYYHTSFDYISLAGTKSIRKMTDGFRGTRYYRVLKGIASLNEDGKPDIEEVSRALYADYYKWALSCIGKQFSGSELSELKAALKRQVVLGDLLAKYREKAYFSDEAERLGEKGAADILREINGKFFKNKIEIDKDNLEMAIRRNSYDYYRRRMRMSKNPMMVLFAFFGILETERQNVTTILESIRYSLPPPEIEKLLVI
ncbi:MAG: V-type ATPase subunit [Oscillospiraceae bacterium]|jgi:V/A-type H+-transporting ATPase subunit C|nr:V-type ATPase subunit [Oscillospiraceae bacterium]